MCAAIALGSNLPSRFGDRAANLTEAAERIGVLGQVVAVSPFYDTAAAILLEQPRFLNGALLLETAFEPVQLLRELLAIEAAMGRDREHAVAKGPRIIDLDLLLYGDVVMTTEELTLPHPELANRLFVLQPLARIAPAWRHAGTGETIVAMLDRLGDHQL